MFKERSLARIFSTLSVICAIHYVNKEGNALISFYIFIVLIERTANCIVSNPPLKVCSVAQSLS